MLHEGAGADIGEPFRVAVCVNCTLLASKLCSFIVTVATLAELKYFPLAEALLLYETAIVGIVLSIVNSVSFAVPAANVLPSQ